MVIFILLGVIGLSTPWTTRRAAILTRPQTEPVKFSAGPSREGNELARVILIDCATEVWAELVFEVAPSRFVWADDEASRESVMAAVVISFISLFLNW